jgi:hypothetical protein
MALVEGTTCGFVTTTPTADPGDSNFDITRNSTVSKFQSPAGASKITEIGWWCDAATEAANFELGLYAADGAVVPGEAGTRLYVAAINAKGTDAGWKKVTVDWDITGNTDYWFGLQVDTTATTTYTNYNPDNGHGRDTLYSSDSLPNPFNGGAISSETAMLAIYALYESGSLIPQAYYYMN